MDLKRESETEQNHTPRGSKLLMVFLILWEVYTLDYVGGVGAALLFAVLLSPGRTNEPVLHIQEEDIQEESDVDLLNRLLDEREKECK